MVQSVDYTDIMEKCSEMSDVASDINLILNAFRYNYPTTHNEGQFATEFCKVRSTIESMTSNMYTFISRYADVLDRLAFCYEELDAQLAGIMQISDERN